VDDRSRILMSACLGAIIGGLGGYLFLTEDGRRVRERLEPGMDDVLREMRHLKSAVEKARLAAQEGWTTIEELRQPLPARTAVRPPTRY
jgi:gas vesicle protein